MLIMFPYCRTVNSEVQKTVINLYKEIVINMNKALLNIHQYSLARKGHI